MDYRWLLRAAHAVVLLVAFVYDARAQKLYPISLCDFSIDAKEINFTVSEIFDARKDKNCIGIIHAGVNNRLQFAVFEKPGLSEIKDLLENSGLYSQQNGLALRITSLKISESDLSWVKTAKAELNIDFFIRYDGLYYYISSVFASVEPKCSDIAGKQ